MVKAQLFLTAATLAAANAFSGMQMPKSVSHAENAAPAATYRCDLRN